MGSQASGKKQIKFLLAAQRLAMAKNNEENEILSMIESQQPLPQAQQQLAPPALCRCAAAASGARRSTEVVGHHPLIVALVDPLQRGTA